MTRRLTAGPPGAGGGAGGGTDLSPVVTISSRDELVSASITPAPNFTLSGKYLFPQIFPLNAGEDVVVSDTSFLGAVIPGCGGFTGDTDSSLLSGPLRANGLALTNVNTGADAYHFEMTTATRPAQIYDCEALGAARGVLVKDAIAGAIRGFTHAIPGGLRGIVFDGSIGQFVVYDPILAGTVSGWRGIELLDTTTVIVAIDIKGAAIGLLDPSHRGFRFADAATVAAGGRLIVTAAANSGDQALLWDQTAGAMLLNDLRLIVDGSTSGNWLACLAAQRTDLADPLIVPYPAFPASAPTPIPYFVGVNPTEIEVVGPFARWQMVKDDPAPGDIYFEFLGPKVGALHNVGVEILVDRNAGTDAIELLIEKAVPAAPTTWLPIESTERSVDNTNSFRQQVSASGEETFSAGDRIRPSSQNLADSVDARIYDITITIASAG